MTHTRSPLDSEPKRIDLSSEEQWFCYRVLRGQLRRSADAGSGSSRPVAVALGKVEAGISSFTAREARRIKRAVADYASGPSVSTLELALSMVVIHRIERAFDLPESDEA